MAVAWRSINILDLMDCALLQNIYLIGGISNGISRIVILDTAEISVILFLILGYKVSANMECLTIWHEFKTWSSSKFKFPVVGAMPQRPVVCS